MKKVILIFFLLGALKSQVHAQVTYFDTCQNLLQYQGEWKYANGLDTVKLYLRYHRSKSNYENGVSKFFDRLLGWIEFKNGNTVVESSYQHRMDVLPLLSDSLNFQDYSLFLNMTNCESNGLLLKGIIWDISTGSKYFEIRSVVDFGRTNMSVSLVYPENYGTISGGTYNMILPQQFNLIKQ